MAVIGGLELEMWAGIARLQKDMGDAKRVVSDATSEMRRMADFAGKALQFLGVGVGLAALKSMVTSAYDAAEALHDLSIQTGASVESLSAMAEIGKTTNTSANDIGSAMNKLAKNLAVASEESKGTGQALKALGIDFDSFKQLKPDDQMLTLAKAMAQFEDGSGKSAVAMTLLGKEGAKLLPFMKDLATSGQLVATVTAEQAAMADEYNDAVTRSHARVEALQRQIAFALLPGLISLRDLTGEVSTLIGDYMASGADRAGSSFDAMGVVIKVVGTAIETLVLVGSDVAFVLKSIGTEIGGLAAQAAAFLSGNFAGAREIGAQMKADAQANRAELDKFQTSIAGVTDRLLTSRDALKNHSLSSAENGNEMKRLQSHYGGVTKKTLDYTAAADKATKVAKEQKSAWAKLSEEIADLLLKQEEQLRSGEKLTEVDKLMLKARRELTGAELDAKLAALEIAKVREEAIEQNKREAGAITEAAKARVDSFNALDKEVEKLHEQIKEQEAANLTLADGRDRTKELEASRLRDAAAIAETMAIRVADRELNFEMAGLYRDQAAGLLKMAELQEKGVALKAAQEAAAEWKKTTDSIYNGLTDSLYRAFESGKDFFSTLWSGVVNTVKTTVLQPIIKFGAQSLLGGLGSMLGLGDAFAGGSGGSGGAGGEGGGLGGLGSIGSLLGSAGGFGSGVMSGLTAWGAEGSVMGLLGSGSSLFAGGIANGLGTLAGALGPVALGIGAIVALAKRFDSSGTPHMGSVVTADASGVRTGGDDPGGILNNFSAETDAALKGLAGGAVGLLNLLSAAFGGTGGFSAATKFTADGHDPTFGAFGLSRDGGLVSEIPHAGSDVKLYDSDRVKAFEAFAGDVGIVVRQAIDVIDLPQWASEALAALGTAPGLDALTAAAQGIAETQRALDAMGAGLEPLGGLFAKLGGLSSDAKFQLAAFTGGIEQFLQKTASYVQNYFSDEEQLALKAQAILKEVGAVGIDASGAQFKQELRELMDTLDPAIEADRAKIAALLNVNADFAKVADYLQENQITLGELAAASPQVAAIDALRSPTEVTADATTKTADAVKTVAEESGKHTEALESIEEATDAAVNVSADGFKMVIALLTSLVDEVKALRGNDELLKAKPA